MTETAKLADVILPGISYAEKEGTFTNTERRIQRIRKAVTIEGEAKPDIWIFTEIMDRMGYAQPHLTPAEIMDEIASVTPSVSDAGTSGNADHACGSVRERVRVFSACTVYAG